MYRNPYAQSLFFGTIVALGVGVLLVLLSLIESRGRIVPGTEGMIIPWLWFGSGFVALGFAQLTCWQVVNALRWRPPPKHEGEAK